MNPIQHKREFTRVPVKVEAKAKIVSDGVFIEGPTRDISMKGLYIFYDRQIPVGSKCEVRLHLGGCESNVYIEAKGLIVRSERDGIAVEFTEMDLDSYNYLHNLVLYNSSGGNTDQIEIECKSHLGIKRRE